MKRNLPYTILLVATIATTITGCDNNQHISRPFAQLLADDKRVNLESASAEKEMTDMASNINLDIQAKTDELKKANDTVTLYKINKKITTMYNISEYTYTMDSYFMEVEADLVNEVCETDIKDGIVNMADLKYPKENGISTSYFMGKANDGKAFELKENINKYKTSILELMDSLNVTDTAMLFNKAILSGVFVDTKESVGAWERSNFYLMNLAEDCLYLDKIKNEIIHIGLAAFKLSKAELKKEIGVSGDVKSALTPPQS